MKRKIRIGIGAVGSGVGQSIIDSCRLSGLPLYTIGFGTNPYAFGAYDCDEKVLTSSIYDEGYIEEILFLCKSKGVDIFIPGLDDEALLLSGNIDVFEAEGIGVIVSERRLLEIARDKERMSRELGKITDNFVRSFNLDNLQQALECGEVQYPLIAKPRSGFASRGIVIIRNQNDLDKVTSSHIIQELAIPGRDDPNRECYLKEVAAGRNPQISEISIQIVTSRNQELIGKVATYNKLNNGVPIEITPYENDAIWEIIERLMPCFLEYGLRGPLNIQGRLTDNGFRIFEMNPRFTGITGLRAIMGFNEVEACIKSWMGMEVRPESLHFNTRKFGMRQVANKSVVMDRAPEVKYLFEVLSGKTGKQRSRVLLTGADGFLGSTILSIAREKYSEDWEWLALVRNKSKKGEEYTSLGIPVYDYEDLEKGQLNPGSIDLIIHAAFARPYRGDAAIAASLRMSLDLFTKASVHQVPRILNISSQSVYGNNPVPWHEEQAPAPHTTYGQAKLACEMYLEMLKANNRILDITSLRLPTLIGPDPAGVDFISKFIVKVLNGADLEVHGGNQICYRLDVRDAAEAVLKMLELPFDSWPLVCNVAAAAPVSIHDVAKKCIEIAIKKKGVCDSRIKLLPGTDTIDALMDGNRFQSLTGWQQRYTLDETLAWMFDAISKAASNN